MTHLEESVGCGFQNLKLGSTTPLCYSWLTLHQMSEFYVKLFSFQVNLIRAQDIFLSTLDITFHENFDEMDPLSEVTHVEGLQDGYSYAKELKLEFHKELTSPGAPCISDEDYSYSQES